MRDDATWTKEILKEVLGSHPLLKDAEFAYAPYWTMAEVPAKADKWNLCFTIVDPDDSIAKNVVASRIIMFATVVTPDYWKEKINLQQCNICWQLIGPHKACMQHKDGKARGCKTCRKSCKPACRLCGSLSHRRTTQLPLQTMHPNWGILRKNQTCRLEMHSLTLCSLHRSSLFRQYRMSGKK